MLTRKLFAEYENFLQMCLQKFYKILYTYSEKRFVSRSRENLAENLNQNFGVVEGVNITINHTSVTFLNLELFTFHFETHG